VIARRTAAQASALASGLSESDLYYLGVSHPLHPQLVLDAQLAYRNTRGSDADVKMAVARLMYYLSRRTATYVAIGTMKNSGASAVALDAGGTAGSGKTQNGVMAGLRHLF